MDLKRLPSAALKLFICLALAALLLGMVDTPGAPGQPGLDPAAVIALTVDATAGQKPISPYLYGLNFAKESFAAEIDLPVRRRGGNLYTRYNGQDNFMNHGSDWFFHNNTHYDPYSGTTQTADQWAGKHLNRRPD